jgi:hypothetical protein
MSVWVILFAKLVLGTVTVRQSFSDFVGSQSEGFSYSLSDYFIGPNLNFTLNTTASSPWATVLSNPFTFNLNTQATVSGSSSASNLSNNRKLRSYVNSSNATCILSYYASNLTSYSVSNNTLIQQWTTKIDNTANNVFINDIAVSRDNSFIYAVISYTTGTLTFTHHTALYMATSFLSGTPTFVLVPGYTFMPQQSIRIEVSGLYAAIVNSTSNSLTSAGTLTVYNITNPSNPANMTVVNTTSSPVDLAFYNAQTLIVADPSLGLLKYYLSNATNTTNTTEVTLINQLSQTNITSIDISGAMGVVALNKSVLLVDLDDFVIDELVNLFSSDGTVGETAVSGKLVGDIAFVNTFSASSNVAIVDFDLLPNQGLIKNWNLASVQTGAFDPYGPYEVFMNADGTYSYVRVDTFITSLANLTIGEWTFSGFTNNQNFTASIVASVGPNTLDNATLTFTGYSVDPNSVVGFSNNSFFTEAVPLELDTNSVYIDLTTSLYANQYFGGSYQQYNVSLVALPNITVTYQKPSKTSASTLLSSLNSTVISGGEGYFILTDGQIVTLYNFTGSQSTVQYSYNSSADADLTSPITAAVWSNGCIVAYSSQANYIQQAYEDSTAGVTDMTCTSLKTSFGYVFCGNSANVTIFSFLPNSVSMVGFVNATTLGLTSLNIADVTFATSTEGYLSRDFVILADASGVIAVSLDQLSASAYQYFGPIGNGTFVSQAVTTGDQFAIVHTDGAVDIYYASYGSAPSLSSRLSGRGNLISASYVSGILSLQYLTEVDIVDLYANAVSAFYTSYMAPACPSASASADFVYVLSLCQLSSYFKLGLSSSLSATQIYGVRTEAGSALNYPLMMTIATSVPYFDSAMTVATGSITAFNSLSSATVPFTLQVTNNGPYLVTTFNQPSLTVDYWQSTTIPVLEYFIGQDLEFILNVNGENPVYEAYSFTYSPIVLNPKIYLSSNYTTVANITGFELNPAFSAVITDTELYFQNNSDTSILNSYDLSSNCTSTSSVSSTALGNGVYAAFVLCMENSLIQNRVAVILTADSEIKALTPNTVPYSLVKTVPLDSQSTLVYYVTPSQNPAGSLLETSFIVDYISFSSAGSDVQFSSYEYTFLDFGIDSLSISAIDSYYTGSSAYVYMADASWGIRVFNVSYNTTTHLITQDFINSIETNSTNPVSIGICGTWLFLGGQDEQIYQYSLSDPTTPVFNQSFYTTGNFTGVNGNINCNAEFDPTYVAVPMMTTDGSSFTTRILSLQANSTSAIYADLTYDFDIATGANYFVNYTTVRALAGQSLIDYKVSVPTLYVQPMTATQYAQVIEHFGTDVFDVYITASNDYVTVNSEVFTLTRSENPDNDDNDDDDDSAMWLALAAGVFILV